MPEPAQPIPGTPIPPVLPNVVKLTEDPSAREAAARVDQVSPTTVSPEAIADLEAMRKKLGIRPEELYIRGSLNPLIVDAFNDPVADRIRAREEAAYRARAGLAERIITRPDRPLEEFRQDTVNASIGAGGAPSSGSAAKGAGGSGRFSMGGATGAMGLPLGSYTYDAPGGLDGTVLANRTRARADWKAALETEAPANTRDTILVAQTGNPDLATLSEEIRAEKTGTDSFWGGMLWDGISTLEVLDYPRRATWLAAMGLGNVAPEIVGEGLGVASDLLGALPSPTPALPPLGAGAAVLDATVQLAQKAQDLLIAPLGRDYARAWMQADPEAATQVAGMIRPMVESIEDSDHSWLTTTPEDLPQLSPEEREAAVEMILPRLQAAAKSGALLRESNAHPGFLAWDRTKDAADTIVGEEWAEVFLPGGRTRNILGRDLLSQGLPREEARRLAQDAFARGAVTEGAMWGSLSTETGQELWGLALDVMLDPLWLMGPAAASKLVHIGNEAWRLARPAVEVARRLEVGGRTWDEAARVVVRATQGEAEAVKLVQDLVVDSADRVASLKTAAARLRAKGPAEAVADAQGTLSRMEAYLAASEQAYRGGDPEGIIQLRAAVAEAQHVATQVSSNPKAFLAGRIRQLEAAADTWQRSALAAQRILKPGNIVNQTGFVPLHIPGGTRTMEAGAGLKRSLYEPMVQRLQTVVSQTTKPWTLAELERKILDAPFQGSPYARAKNALAPAELVAWTVQRTTGRALNFPAQIWRLLAMSLGTRFLEPASMAASKWLSLWGKDEGAGRYLLEHGGDLGRQIALPGVSRELWGNMQGSLGRFIDSLGSKGAFLKSQLMRIKRAAEVILRERLDAVRAGKPGIPAEWSRQGYGLDDIMAEAGNLMEEGAGELQRRPELADLVHRFAAIRDELTSTPQGAAYIQDYLRVARSLEGSPEQMRIARGLLDGAVNLHTAETRALEVEEAALERLQRSASRAARLAQILSPASQQGLVRALLKWSGGGGAHAAGAFRAALTTEIAAAAQRLPAGPRRTAMLARQADAADEILRELGALLGGAGDQTADDIARRLMKLAVAETDGLQSAGKLEALLKKGLERLALRAKATSQALADAMLDPTGRSAEKLADLATRDRIVRLRVLVAEAEAIPELGQATRTLVAQAASGDAAAVKLLTEHLGERRGNAIVSHWKAVVARATERAKAPTQLIPDQIATGTMSIESVDNLLRMVAFGKPPKDIQAATARAVQDLLEDSMRLGAGATGGPRKLPGEWVMRLLSEIQTALRKAPRGVAWRNAADAVLTDFRKAIVDRADDLTADVQQLQQSIATRKETLALLDAEIVQHKEAFQQALVTVKAAPGDVVDTVTVGNNLATPGVRRAAEAWELALWEKHRVVTAGYTEEEGLLGAFSMLQDAASTPARAGDMGRRLAKLDDPAMVELTGAMKHLFDQYEEWYKAAGFGFVKDPVERLKMWGTVGYVPHIRVEAESVAKGALAGSVMPRGITTTPRGVAATDAVLNTAMGARKQRQIAGTIAEINAAGTDVSMTLGLDRILTRYMASNGAVSAMDFMSFMVKSGIVQKVAPLVDPVTGLVTKGVTEQALEAGLVPLFGRPNLRRDMDMLISGSREDWLKAGVTADELDAAITILSARKRGASEGVIGQIVRGAPDGAGPESPFASWLRQAPVAQAGANVEGAILAIRREGLLAGANPMAPLWTTADALARHGGDWMQVAAELNAAANRAGIPHAGVDMLKAYHTDQTWRLFVPGRVAEAMTRIFEETKPTSELAKVLKGGVDYVNGIYKTLLTIRTTSFSLRNFTGNTLSNMLDLGLHGALSPQTNYDATRLYLAWLTVEKYGSLEAAQKVGSWELKMPGVEDLWRNGFDLGDGTIRPAQEVLKILSEHEALSRAYTVVGDIGRYDEELAEGMVRSLREAPGRWAWKNVVQPAPGNALVLMSFLLGAPGTVLPKKFGEHIARFVEGQSRLVNFIANVRRGGSFTEAGQHVQKFLFNYEDLTEFQKVWMRTFIPFFTWSQKNVMLHAEMATKHPAYYQQFFETAVHLERISAAIDRDAGIDYGWPISTYDTTEQRMKNPAHRSKVTIPVPAVLTDSDHPYLYLTGIGSPVEGMVDMVAMLGGLADLPAWINGSWDPARAMSMTSWMIQLPLQWSLNRDFYYGRSLDELNNGARAVQWLEALERSTETLAAIPGGVGRPFAGLYAALHEASRIILKPVVTLDPVTGRESVKGEGRRLWLLNAVPYSAMLRKITASVDVYATALVTDAGQLDNPYVAPGWVRFANSMMGLQVIQMDPWTNRERLERDILSAQEEAAKNLGYGREQEVFRVR